MRNFLAKLILGLARLVTFGMNPERKNDVFWQVANRLFPINTINAETKRGKLLLDFSCRNFVQRAGRKTGLEHNEYDTYDWIESLPKNSCLWDIGANVGIFGLLASIDPTIRVLGFEPAAVNYAVLNRNIELNRVAGRFKAYCIALAEFSKLDDLNMGDVSVGSYMHGFGVEFDQFRRPIDVKFRQGAVGFSIDDFVRLFAPPLPTHIKLDVDGLEPEILRGGRETLSSSQVKSVIIEVEEKHGDSRGREIYDLMAIYGFLPRDKEYPESRNVIFDK